MIIYYNKNVDIKSSSGTLKNEKLESQIT